MQGNAVLSERAAAFEYGLSNPESQPMPLGADRFRYWTSCHTLGSSPFFLRGPSLFSMTLFFIQP